MRTFDDHVHLATLRWGLAVRWVLLGLLVLLNVLVGRYGPDGSGFTAGWIVAGLLALSNVLHGSVLKRRGLKASAWLHGQGGWDLLLVAILVYSTGGLDSPFTWLFVGPIMMAALMAGWRFGLLAVTMSVLLLAAPLLLPVDRIFPSGSEASVLMPSSWIASAAERGAPRWALPWLGVVAHAMLFGMAGALCSWFHGNIRRASEQLVEATQQLQMQAAALSAVGVGVVLTDPSWRIVWANRAFEHLVGMPLDAMAGRSLPELDAETSGKGADGADEDGYPYGRAKAAVAEGRVWQRERVRHRADGSARVEKQTISAVMGDDGAPAFFVVVREDVTQSRRQEERLQYLTTHDAVTGLLNRHAFEMAVKGWVSKGQDDGAGVVLFIDIDRFQVVNDTLGHVKGDALLRDVAHLLQRHLSPEHVIARSGGDEFVVLLKGLDEAEGRAVAEELREAVERTPFAMDGHRFPLTLSIGLAPVEGREGGDGSLSRAEAAVLLAKQRGGNQVAVYRAEESPVKRLGHDQTYGGRLRDALERDDFVLLFQPVVRLEDGWVRYWEVLVRLRSDDGEGGGDEGGRLQRLVSPGVFMPVAERLRLSPSIDRWVIRKVIEVLRNRPGVNLFVNLSAHSLGDASTLTFIAEELGKSGVDPVRLGFEITETTVVEDFQRAERWIRRLKGLGCEFALDDFGSGHSTFFYLRYLPVDIVKIDGGFIERLDEDPAVGVMVRAMAVMAQGLGLEIVAEHVERKDMVRTLMEMGVQYGQGWALGKPVPLDELPR